MSHPDYRAHPQVIVADRVAEAAHAGQQRKYTFEPYIVHPREVMQIVASVPHTPEQLQAALLHDVMEDCGIQKNYLVDVFGHRVADLVEMLTDISKPEHGNRTHRKAMDRLHIAMADPEAKTVKLADLLSNTTTIVKHDRGFAKTYMDEKWKLLGVLSEGDPVLYNRALLVVNDYFEQNSINLIEQP